MFLALVLACSGPDSVDTAPGDTADPIVDACAYDMDTDTTPLLLEGNVDCGAMIFERDCAGCHGPTGEGTDQGPALEEHIQGHSDIELLAVVVVGAGDMPPSGLPPQGSADVLAWLRATFGEYTDTTH
jgi:mono/diheme cytochrome c family protein